MVAVWQTSEVTRGQRNEAKTEKQSRGCHGGKKNLI